MAVCSTLAAMMLATAGCGGKSPADSEQDASTNAPDAGGGSDPSDAGGGADASDAGPPDTTAPSAPVLDSIRHASNRVGLTLTGSCETDSTVQVTCVGPGDDRLATAECTAGTFSATVTLEPGVFTCSAVATDAAGNTSTESDSVEREVCDPRDEYDASDPDAGDTVLSAVDLSPPMPDDGSVTIMTTGNLADLGDEDWFLLHGTDSLLVNQVSGANEYYVSAGIVGEGVKMFVYRAGRIQCGAFNGGYGLFGDGYATTSPLQSQTDQCAASGGGLDPDNEPTQCSDFSAVYAVHVVRTDDVDDCRPYTLTAVNAAGTAGGNGGACTLHADFPPGQPSLMISEIADPPTPESRYVEVWNRSVSEVDLSLYELRLYSNGASTPTVFHLSGSLAAGEVAVVAKDATAFENAFGSAPDLSSSVVNGDGNDVYELCYVQQEDVRCHTYGEVGVDGAGTWWEYQDSVVQLRPEAYLVSMYSDVLGWAPADYWNISAGTADATPGTR